MNTIENLKIKPPVIAGYRSNVGIILINKQGQFFWGCHIKHKNWQFPQGGIEDHETVEEALWRELYEEVGLKQTHVTVEKVSFQWLSYDIPKHLKRKGEFYKGQIQKWVLLRLTADDSCINTQAFSVAEFSNWLWTDAQTVLQQICNFKLDVYKKALSEFKLMPKPILNLFCPRTAEPINRKCFASYREYRVGFANEQLCTEFAKGIGNVEQDKFYFDVLIKEYRQRKRFKKQLHRK